MSQPPYILHYAPDNASLAVRLALEELSLDYETRLVDRQRKAQQRPAYLALNPTGLIPVLETPSGPIFETAAILLWLADRHGGLAPGPQDAERGDCLAWLFFLSNTLHPALRRLFYPAVFAGPSADAQAAMTEATRAQVLAHLALLDARFARARRGLILDLYLAPLLRWPALYPIGTDRGWYDLGAFPALRAALAAVEARPCARAAARAEGLGPTPFTAPRLPEPPEGSAL